MRILCTILLHLLTAASLVGCYLYDISVGKDECNNDCIMWEMVRDKDTSQTITQEEIIKFPVVYGMAIYPMKNRLGPRPLVPGKYYITASMATVENMKISKSKPVHTVFEVDSK